MKKILLCLALIAIATLLVAQRKGSILQPQMKVEHGSYTSPMGTLGEKPADAWTATTVAAGVDKKPLPGKPVTRTGEILDLSCYLQLGKHGEPHRACGTKCLQAGEPIGMLAEDGSVYMLMAEEHDPRRDGQTTFRQAAIEHFAHIMEVTGTESTVNGYHAIYVQGYVKK